MYDRERRVTQRGEARGWTEGLGVGGVFVVSLEVPVTTPPKRRSAQQFSS